MAQGRVLPSLAPQMASSPSELSKAHMTCFPSAELDLISKLPEDLRQKILTYLPIKEAGRTSVLSHKWRYTWASIPELKFVDTRDKSNNLEKIVDAIFVLHSGPIRKFSISTGKTYCEAFDRWIVNLSRNGIKELTLNVCFGDYMIPSRFFSCDELNYIYLNGCSFRVPDQFDGFKLLHTLMLNIFRISEGEIEKLLSTCPLLRKLKLGFWGHPTIALKIDAPNLLSLDIDGQFTDLQLCAPKLVYLCLALDYCVERSMSENIERGLSKMRNLESLELKGSFLGFMGVENLQEGISLNCLKRLTISLELKTEKEAAFVVTLFQGAPNLHSLRIVVWLRQNRPALPTANFWETVDRKDDWFKHLKTLEIVDMRALESIFSFIKFVLDSAPQLVTLTIKANPWFKKNEEPKILMKLEQLLLLTRASPNVQIIYK